MEVRGDAFSYHGRDDSHLQDWLVLMGWEQDADMERVLEEQKDIRLAWLNGTESDGWKVTTRLLTTPTAVSREGSSMLRLTASISTSYRFLAQPFTLCVRLASSRT